MSRIASVSETQTKDEALAIKGFRALMHVWIVENYKTLVLSRFCGTNGDFTLVNIYGNEVMDGPLVGWVKDNGTMAVVDILPYNGVSAYEHEMLHSADPAFFDKIRKGFKRLGVV